jgi:general secretion pathway protein J
MNGAAATPSRDPEAGFTLMELLVAITLLSLLSLVLTSSLRFGLTAWARGTDHAERVDHGLIVQDFLRRAIGDAYPYFLSTDPTRGTGRVDFVGTAQSLRFLSPAPIALGGRGRVRFEVSVDRNGGRSDLVVASAPELADSTSTPERKILMPDVEAIELAYFGKRRSDRAANWHDAWAEEPALPQLVRLKVRLRSGDTRAWPDLVVAPRITADVSCVHDPLTKRCRGR